MKILIGCCWPPELGQGISTVSRDIATALAKHGHDVHYLSPPSCFSDWYRDNGIHNVSIGPEVSAAAGLSLVREYHAAVCPDLTLNNDHPYLQAAFPLLTGTKAVICHTLNWATFELAITNHEHIDHIFALSVDMWERLVRKGVNPAKIKIVQNGIHDPVNANQLFDQTSDRPNLRAVFAGSWTRVKGADLLIRAIKNAPPDLEWLTVDCFGDGRLLGEATKIDRSWLKVHGRVPREQFLSVLRESDVLLFPSRTEGCPMTIIEAQAYGVIPIASNGRGAMREMVTHGLDGFLVRLSDFDTDMWNILTALKNQPDYLSMIKRNARDTFLTRFTIERQIDHILAIAAYGGHRQSGHAGPARPICWHRPSQLSKKIPRLRARVAYRLGIILRG
ncbi:MAG: glycosyltransferase family 4 protein [Prosthecobacter sp.]|nr:glycosyltransferase family 4 protein [Prosthecobacter sp.]